jgi:hypothetical protein
MTIDLAEEPMTALGEYALLPIAFRVDHTIPNLAGIIALLGEASL